MKLTKTILMIALHFCITWQCVAQTPLNIDGQTFGGGSTFGNGQTLNVLPSLIPLAPVNVLNQNTTCSLPAGQLQQVTIDPNLNEETNVALDVYKTIGKALNQYLMEGTPNPPTLFIYLKPGLYEEKVIHQ